MAPRSGPWPNGTWKKWPVASSKPCILVAERVVEACVLVTGKHEDVRDAAASAVTPRTATAGQ